VIAPPGFGKTTLLAQLVTSLDSGSPPSIAGHPLVGGRRVATSWLTLDGGDSQPTRLVHALAAALRRVEPGIGVLAVAAAPEAALAAMLNTLASRSEPLVLILDDYHTLNDAAAHALIGQMIGRAPAVLHLMIAGREEPPLPLARLRVDGRLSELRVPELRFHGEETAALVQLISGQRLAAAEIATLEERTEGWAAGLQLAGLALRGQSDARAFTAAFAGTHRFVMDYLIEEVLSQQPPRLRRFLLETSVLERLSAPLCAALQGSEPSESQVLLEEAERRGMFLVALDEERRWYRYHTLFAEVLRAELRREVGWGRLDELRQMARRLSSGQWSEGERQIAEQLTGREREVLELMAEGATNGEIAERLCIAVSTVKAHINSVFSKLDARSRTQAVARARVRGLLR
jgi:LuxR family maltose regulon positive regulatory protein